MSDYRAIHIPGTSKIAGAIELGLQSSKLGVDSFSSLSGRTTAAMAPSRNLPDSDASSMVDTPMTDGNESVARIPVDEPDYAMAVSPSSESVSLYA